MANELIIAAAGSGKTSRIIKRALAIKDESVLITTYTESNELEIKQRIILKNGCIPENVKIQTWFAFLIQHGVKPYQSYLYDKKVGGMILVNEASGVKLKTNKGYNVYFGENKVDHHYFSKHGKIYSDKLAKFVVKVNEASEGMVIDRLCRIYSNIFIDESQDLAGHDLIIIKLLAKRASNLLLVCDPRQVTYLTHLERKYAKYRNGLLKQFIDGECKRCNFSIDETSLSHSHRCNHAICDYSNKLYPDIPPCQSSQTEVTGHDAIFLVKREDCKAYLEQYTPVQLRWSAAVKDIDDSRAVYTFGVSKGLAFRRVLIYPTDGMIAWMKDNTAKIKDQTRAKFYVGITRAQHSVGIVCDGFDGFDMNGISQYTSSPE